MLDVWATWCGPCCNEIPFLAKMEERLQGTEYRIRVVVRGQGRRPGEMDKNDAGKRDEGGTVATTGKKSELNETLCISGIPHFAIIDPTGNWCETVCPVFLTG